MLDQGLRTQGFSDDSRQCDASNGSVDRSDRALIAAIDAGDAGAFEELYFRHRSWVTGLAHRFTGDADLALDVMQETFLYVLKKFPGFQLTASFRTFLYPAVKNLSLTARRKARSLETAVENLDELAAESPTPDSAGASDDLAVVLAQLSGKHREVLWLRCVDGFTLDEIAAALEIPLGTVKSRFHYALDLLRQDPRTRKFFEK
jgi:RNA polymerase sigma-70 factor, ECF subfamily